MELTGKIKLIGETKTFGDNGFRKRELVIVTQEQYPQTILVEFIKDKCDLLDSFSKDQEVKIRINIQGREWTNPEGEVKYFNSIQGWQIENGSNNIPEPPKPQDVSLSNEKEDRLPF